MNEEEIIEWLKNTSLDTLEYKKDMEAIQGLLDLYKQEKEKNKEYEKQLDLDYVEQNFIRKDKIKEKLELLKDILKAKEKDGNIYKQISIEYLKGAIEQLEELLEGK